MASFTLGREYRFTLSDGTIIVLRFKGLGKYNHPEWVDPKNNSPVNLPPYRSYEEA